MNRFAIPLAAFLLPSVALAAKPKTYDSPKAVFAAAVAASKKKAWRTFFSCLDKKSHDRLALQALAASFQLRKGDEDDKKIQEALKAFDNATRKHGLKKEDLEKVEDFLAGPPPETEAERVKKVGELLKPIEDRVGFLVDAIEAFGKAQKMGDPPLSGATLEDVKVTGAKATGTIVQKRFGKDVKQPAEFVKEGGGWKLVAPKQGR